MNQLPWLLEIPVVLLSALAGRWYGMRLHERGVELTHVLRVRDAPLLPLGLLGFVSTVIAHNLTMTNPHWSWYLPVTMEYYIQPIMWGLQVVFLWFSLSTVTLLSFRMSRFRGVTSLVFMIVVFAAVEGILRANSGSIEVTHPPRTKDGIIQQTTDATCAAASGANVARYFDIDTTEAKMAEAMNTNRYGTTPSQIIRGLESLGLHARKVTVDPGSVSEVRPPAVLLVNNTDLIDGHAVVLMGFQDGLAEVWDPLGSRVRYTPSVFREKWVGHAIEVSDRPF